MDHTYALNASHSTAFKRCPVKLSRSWLIALTIFLLTMIWVFSGSEHQSSAVENIAQDQKSPFKVRVIPVQSQTMTNQLQLKGITQPQRALQVKAQTQGVVESLLVKKGDLVEEETPLVQLDTQDRRLQLEQAKAALQDAELQMDAVKQMVKKGLSDSSQLARTQAQLATARSNLLKAELELSYLTIKAPFAGIIDDRMVEIGQLIHRGDPVMQLIDLDPIKVIAQVSERYVGQIKQNTEGSISLQNGPALPARITYVGRNAQNPTRTFPVEMEVDNPDLTLIAGATANIHIPITNIQAQHIPTSALTLSDKGEIGVKTVTEDSQVVFHEIDFLSEADEGIWVSGIPEGAKVITLGQDFVLAGETVDAVNDHNANMQATVEEQPQ